MSWVHSATRWKINWPKKLDSENTKLDPCQRTQPDICKENMEWKLEMNLQTQTSLTRGSEAHMDWTSRQRGGDLWDEDGSIFVENGCICFCKPIKGQQNHGDLPLLAHLQELYLFVEMNVDWHWTRNSIQSSVPSGKKTEYSSSAWRITSRRKWSYRVLEIKRLSSERIWALSTLVWWNVEQPMAGSGGNKKRFQYWLVKTRNSSFPRSSRSFRTHSHWYYTSGQCVNSGRFLRVHLSYWMCNQLTLHHKFRIDSGRTEF